MLHWFYFEWFEELKLRLIPIQRNMRGLSVSYLKAPRHLFYLLYIILTVYFFIQIVFVMFKMLLVSPYLRSKFHEIWIQASLHGSFVKPLVCVHTILSNSTHLFSTDLHIIYWNILIWSMFFIYKLHYISILIEIRWCINFFSQSIKWL